MMKQNHKDIRITWLSQADVFYESVDAGQLMPFSTGGLEYNFEAYQILAERFIAGTDREFERRAGESVVAYGKRIRRQSSPEGLLIKDPMVFTFHRNNGSSISIGMVHHIDLEKKKSNLKNRIYFTRLERSLKKLDHVVVVSRYWEEYVRSKGVRSTSVIYNAFDPEDFSRTAEQVTALREKLGLEPGKPVIYLGKATIEKGMLRAYGQLHGKPYQLVTTGKQTGQEPSGIMVLNLSKEDYITLLHLADAVVTMPLFPEGWSRIAHESLLCRTPVIGVESGGMTELLQQSGQRILAADAELQETLREVLEQKDAYGEKGFAFVSKLNSEYFREAWVALVEKLSR